MDSIIVVPPGRPETGDQITLAPGERLVFGRNPDASGARGRRLTIAHDGVSRVAGEIVAEGSFWTLSNLNRRLTYAVENPQGAGEHVKVAPGRLEAPIPFEFARIVLPAAGELLGIDVWAPRHDYLGEASWAPDGATTAPSFSLDRTKRYFAVLVALCEPRLRDDPPHTAVPTAEEVVERLRPVWPAASRTAVQWNINYLAVKLRLKPTPETAVPGVRRNGTKESLVSLALRFDLVCEDDLVLLSCANSVSR
ncbi:FHA domain-containing protein [Streptomyces sp. NPDC050504]|uniref:FHA domain-containing protein n=1 Tax=Streptomyces sp. NPDC050504 TaxID=3365618 RepID=UPI0037A6A677